MDETAVEAIAGRIVADTQFWIALIGILGGIVGACITLASEVIIHWLRGRRQNALDQKRIKLLREMLDDARFPGKWRNLTTLAAVIGADEAETKRLLIEAEARGSEKADGKWGLIKNHPLPRNE